MIALRLAPIALAGLLLAAHFFRAGQFLLLGLVMAAVALLAVRRPWAARGLQIGLALGALEWLHTLVALTATRRAMGQPYLRLTLILGGVALLTALAGLVFRSPRVRAHFRLPPSPAT